MTAVNNVTLCITYTRSIKRSVGWSVKTGMVNISLRPPRCSDEARDDKGENDTQHGEGEGESGTLIAVCLWQDITCSNVEQEAGKEAQVIRQSNGGNPEEYGGDGTSHRCYRVCQQQQEGTARGVLID